MTINFTYIFVGLFVLGLFMGFLANKKGRNKYFWFFCAFVPGLNVIFLSQILKLPPVSVNTNVDDL